MAGSWLPGRYELGVLLRCKCEMNTSQLPPVQCLRRVSIRVSLSKPLMSVALEKQLNPLAITLIRAESMPDKPLNYRQLLERCKEPYAWYEFLGQRRETFRHKHAKTLTWNHTSVFFAGKHDQAALIKVLEGAPLKVHESCPRTLTHGSGDAMRDAMPCHAMLEMRCT